MVVRFVEDFMRTAVVALSVGICFVAAGCGQKSNTKTVTIAGKDGNVTVSGNDQHMVIKSENGNATVEYSAQGMVHANMPDYAPLYPGAKVSSSVSSNGNNSSGAMVTFSVSAAPADVVAFYKQKAHAAGFSDTMNTATDNSMAFIATKDKKTLEVVASKSSDGTQAQVIWSSGQ